ncbi:MAG TPA: hypothetical protein VM689_02045 [Aliidongia sp.]|nr:hypothetical protein [Aliidongia sp.]
MGTARRIGRNLILLALSGCAGQSPANPDLRQLYESAIRDSAVRTPQSSVALETIGSDHPEVTVATFTEWGVPATPLSRYTWVSLPQQLHALCRQKPDTILAIQEILGLPPAPNPSQPGHRYQVITFKVPRESLFRPCPSGTDVGTPRCAIDQTAKLDPETTRFLLDQIWSSDQLSDRPAQIAGYPFTGMGWSYDWDPASPNHVGVSEYVIRPGAKISDPEIHEPAAFCNAS